MAAPVLGDGAPVLGDGVGAVDGAWVWGLGAPRLEG